ncbi:malate dehydrogenase [Candidatus Woesearchaeota archaeon]|nr:malate dehydrogenase [Candidatus Woesearchaeota archaeon]
MTHHLNGLLNNSLKEKSLNYHHQGKPGKLTINPSKPCTTADELSLAYTPGVAFPCLEIQINPDDAYKYTNKGNLVAVISNGTAVLGLGNIGALAGKPVMEGKAVLFKRFAGIDAMDLEINESDPEKLVQIISSLSISFGGINLEDIKAPECFYVETELQKRANIPVFHDDQHGTSIIASAALLNALEITKKKISNVKIVFSGAGAAALSTAKLLLDLGAHLENIFMVDREGVITTNRLFHINEHKKLFARQTNCKTLTEIIVGADVFIGLSKPNVLTAEDIKKMNSYPIVFAMANPTSEVAYDVAKNAVPEIIFATGRSDYPNQVNNVLGFPFLFRAALDTRASHINKEMKLAAVKALADLAKKKVPKEVIAAYGQEFSFGPEYIIPKPFDPRVLSEVTPKIAEAAMNSGIAQKKINLNEYSHELKKLGKKLAKGIF